MMLRTLAVLATAAAVAGCAAPSNAGVQSLEPDTYGAWNTNDDECLNQNEFGANWDNEFGVWDGDDDGFIDADEWGVEVGTDEIDTFGSFGDWDMDDDDRLTDLEFAGGSFGIFDENDDDCIGVAEFSAGIEMF